MDRSTTKERGRRKLIRDRTNALKEKPPRKAPTKEIIKQAGRYRAVATAKRQLNEARQAIVPDQEQEPYTAVDKVETYTANAAHEVLQALPSAPKSKPRTDNSFHGETDFREEAPHKPTPQERMRREAIKEFRQRRTAEQQNAFHGETHLELPKVPQPKDRTRKSFIRQLREREQHAARNTRVPEAQEKPTETAMRRDRTSPAQKRASEHRERTKGSVSTTTTGQRQTALPREPSSGSAPKAQLVKEQGRRYARNQAIQEIKNGTTKSLSGKAAKASGDFVSVKRNRKGARRMRAPRCGRLLS